MPDKSQVVEKCYNEMMLEKVLNKLLFISFETLFTDKESFKTDLNYQAPSSFLISSLKELQKRGFHLIFFKQSSSSVSELSFECLSQTLLSEEIRTELIVRDNKTHFLSNCLRLVAEKPIDKNNSFIVKKKKDINLLLVEDIAKALDIPEIILSEVSSEASTNHIFSSWKKISHYIIHRHRISVVKRQTRETNVLMKIHLDGEGEARVKTGIAFFDHMLESLSKHSGIGLEIDIQGDIAVDAHHTIEDCGIALGQGIRLALGDKYGIARYGFLLPMDETLAHCALDLSGRAYLNFSLPDIENFRQNINGFPLEMLEHFYKSLTDHAQINLDIQLKGKNAHHLIEASFKAFAKCLGQAIDQVGQGMPSTKGCL